MVNEIPLLDYTCKLHNAIDRAKSYTNFKGEKPKTRTLANVILTVLPDLSLKKTLYSKDPAAPSSTTEYSADTTLQPWYFRVCTMGPCTKDCRSGATFKQREAVDDNADLWYPLTTTELAHCGKRRAPPLTIALTAAIATYAHYNSVTNPSKSTIHDTLDIIPNH